MFEQATRTKLRFHVQGNGYLCVEDLWDISLDGSGPLCLNSIAKDLSKQIKESDSEDFVSKKSNKDSVLEAKFELVKHIISVRVTERDNKVDQQKTKQLKQKLLSIKEKQEEDALLNKTPEELDAMLKELG